MRKIVCFFMVMICSSVYVDAMMNKLAIRRSRSYRHKRPKIQKEKLIDCSSRGTFHPLFSKEIDLNIFRFIGTNTGGETLKKSAQIFSALICVNKFSSMHMDDDQRTLGWIKDLSKRFDCANIDVARALRTRVGKSRLVMQLGLWLNCYPGDSYLTERIGELQTCGLDVNFSYDKQYPSPLLQCCSDLYNRDVAAHCLIDNGADINICTPDGSNACLLTLLKGRSVLLNKLVEHKGFKPNHQNHNGETVLLAYLYRFIDSPDYVPGLGPVINVADVCNMITRIVAKGADPTLANNDGMTPLMIVRSKMMQQEELRDKIAELLECAVADFELKKN